MFNFNNYFEAYSIEEAADILATNENAKIIAGGTDVLIKLREHSPKFAGCDFVGITRISDLQQIELTNTGDVLIGGCNSFTKIEESSLIKERIPALSQACSFVGGPQIRNMGTIGGNIANGATSADTASILFALNAVLLISNTKGKEEIDIKDFYQGAGKVNLSQGDILTHIKIKQEDYLGFKGFYIKFAVRKAMDIATLGCAVSVKASGNIIEDLRIAFGVAGPTPVRAKNAEQFAKGLEITVKTLETIGLKCLEDTSARESWRASKRFREQLIKTLPQKAIKKALAGDFNE